MAIAFPANPTTNQTYSNSGVTWTYDGKKWLRTASGTGGATVAASDTRPATTTAGSLWLDTNAGELAVYQGTGWVNIGEGSSGYTGSVGYAGSTGSTGYTGSRGQDGVIGYNGSTGYTGSVGGIGYVGSVGYTGSRGTDGVVGYNGSIGYTGSSGAAASTPAAVSDQSNTSTGYFNLPKGTTSQRPASPAIGMLRYNTTLGTLEQYNVIGWESIGGNQPVIAGISAQIYNAFAGSITIAGNYFGLNAVTVRFSFGATIVDVSLTPGSTTSITVSVPSAIYSLAAGTSGNISVIDSAGRQSNGFSKTVVGLPGSSSSYPAASPYAIRLARGSTPAAGIYWFSNSGFNAGGAFQAYADWSTDSTYGMLVLCGLLMNDNARTSYTQFGTAGTSSAGTPGFRNTHNLASNTILSNWTGDTRNRCYLGMTSQSGGSDIGSATNQWLLMNTSLTVFRNMFNDAPGFGEFDFPTGIVNTSTGASGRLYYTTNHGGNLYQMTNAGNTVNANLWFEMADTGSGDMNHSAAVWAAGNGQYYGAPSGGVLFSSRWMFMAMSPDNT